MKKIILIEIEEEEKELINLLKEKGSIIEEINVEEDEIEEIGYPTIYFP